jgi:hypothetical protein
MATLERTAERRRVADLGAVARTVGQIALLILAVALAARAFFYLGAGLDMMRWPFEAANGESTMLSESELLASDPVAGLRALYGPQPPDRFIAGNYPPLYLALWALKPGPSAFPTGRALSIAAAIITALAGGVAAYSVARGARRVRLGVGVLGGGLVICTVPVFQQLSVAKPDMVALACAACGLACFERWQGRRGLVAAGAFFALALLAKQSIGFALVAAGIAALRRGPRAALTLGVATAAVLGGVLGAIWLLGGTALHEHLILYNRRDWLPDRFESLNRKFVEQHWPLLVAGFAYVPWALRARPRSALTYYPLVALATMFTVGSAGGGRSYYIELCLAVGLAAALGVGAFLEARPAVALPLATAALLLLGTHATRAYTLFIPGLYVPTPPVARGGELNRMLAVVDAAPDPVLVLVDTPDGYLEMRGRPVVIDDPYLAQVARQQGRWSTDGIEAGLAARRYSLVLTGGTDDATLRKQWGDDLVTALYANYERAGKDGFVPKAR